MQKTMKRILLLLVVMFTFSSCEIIGDIFKAGMGVGVFIAIAVLALIIFLISKMFGKK
ncbi:hypothetical protein [Flavobacterium undicola]|uniref:hypothetical protein n=1 Tax=Flavobacterium undicola TaxID=1932779 RepID=UPI0015E221DF|nr:hypothetical protein [Flavobacterium undicola]MBA0885010.1 hypothetical protein [Flavobacterium undicola]